MTETEIDRQRQTERDGNRDRQRDTQRDTERGSGKWMDSMVAVDVTSQEARSTPVLVDSERNLQNQ